MLTTEKKIFIENLDKKNILVLDPDNVFWAIFQKNNDKLEYALPRGLVSLYNRVSNKLDKELNDFRFSANLSAIYINTTDKCNANCPYCYIPNKIRKEGRSMNYQQLEYILTKIALYFKSSTKKAVIVFHASEPLITKDIIFKAISKFNKQFKFGLQTNAILMKKDDVAFLKRYGVGVGISLDSFDLRTNIRSRPNWISGSNFSSAVRAIEWFEGYPGLNVITTITKFNVMQLPKIVEFLHRRKVSCILLNPVRLTQEQSRRIKPNEKIMTRYFIKAVQRGIELSRNSSHRIIIGNFSNIILGIVAPTARRLMCDISPCGGGRCFLTITASGDMIPCGEFIGLKGFRGGNIFSAKGRSASGRRNSIEQTMQSKPFKRIRSRIVEKITECDSCIFRNICGAPCPAELHSLGNMRQKSIFCEFYKEIIKHAFKLISKGEEQYLIRKDALGNLKYHYQL